MDRHPCQICERPTDGFACTTCAASYRAALIQTAELLAHIDAIRAGTKAITYGAVSTGGSRETGIKLDPRIHTTLVGLTNHLTTLARDIHAHDPSLEAATLLERDTPIALAVALTRHASWLRMQQQGPEAFTTTTRWAARLTRLTDVRPATLVLGECRAPLSDGEECPAIVYSPVPLPSYVRCPACSYQHDAHARRDEILTLAYDVVGTAREISGLLCAMTGTRTTPDAIRRMKNRGRFGVVSTVREKGRLVDTYRLGDIIGARAS